MILPQYQIVVISCVTGEVITVFDGAGFYDLRYNRRLNDIGTIVMTAPGTDENYAMFAWDNFIEVLRTSPSTGQLIVEETYLVRSKQVFTEQDQDILVVGGLSLNSLAARRIIDPDDDSASLNGYSTKTGAADVVMRAYAREQMADLASTDRQIPGLTVLPVDGVGIAVEESKRYDSLYTTLRDLAIRSAIDFQISRTTAANMELSIGRRGSDKTKNTNYPFGQWVGLTPLRRNLSSPSLTIDRTDEDNFVYVLGQGQGEDRAIFKIAGDTAYSPFGRSEFVQDARNVDKTSANGLFTMGAVAINKNKVNKEFSFSPTNTEPGGVYRIDWDIADKVTVIWKTEEIDLRLTAVEIEINESGEELSVTVEELYD